MHCLEDTHYAPGHTSVALAERLSGAEIAVATTKSSIRSVDFATRGVAVMLEHGALPEDPVAAAARNLAERIVSPGSTRH